MLVLTAGFAATALTANLAKADDSPPWFISEDELKITILNPDPKKTGKRIKINRHGSFTRHENLIKKAEAIYPKVIPEAVAREMERSGTPSSFLNLKRDRTRFAYNITASAVNYYLEDAIYDKRANAEYRVGVDEVFGWRKGSLEPRKLYDVSLYLSWGGTWGPNYAHSFSRRKKVIFDADGNVESLFMPIDAGYAIS